MNAQHHSMLKRFATLLTYPDSEYVDASVALGAALESTHSDVLDDLREFQEFVAASDLHELEEHFTRTFEINPQCALELGWHLFGEEYLRGQLLVRLREELRRFEIAESTELPDHMMHVLAIVSAMPSDEAVIFTEACVLPALHKMLVALEGKQNAYEHLLRCLLLVLCQMFDLPETCPNDEEEIESNAHADPLRSYPVRVADAASVVPGTSDILHGLPPFGECHRSVEFVPLQLQFDDGGKSQNGQRATGGETT